MTQSEVDRERREHAVHPDDALDVRQDADGLYVTLTFNHHDRRVPVEIESPTTRSQGHGQEARRR
jgi:hypothetical protein